jgi:hypothetical protein
MGATEEHMADGDFAEHFGGQVAEFAAAGKAVEVRAIAGLDFRNAEAVGVRVVEEVALDAPGFVEDLPPLGAGVDVGGHVAEVEGLTRVAVAGLEVVSGGD